ncbi:acetate/propionate family kinase [Natronoglycomyces albus]|uniref:Acetate kinase n=1 Tax=Natronoglycomyces albus TaxID=2811108 RepID=A0A895XNJ4_9ACTN|nr:acetate kinase [Natronoglycomyces albus]QSB04066.1 acetate kinase [Natronoglycomyces albus]
MTTANHTNQHVLVINCGSSSLKYQLLNADHTTEALASGLIERIGQAQSTLTHRHGSHKRRIEQAIPDHAAALDAMQAAFVETATPLSETNLVAVAHRVVHGGEKFVAPVLVTDEVEKTIASLIPLAPLHNPANLQGIRTARNIFDNLPQVAVFDTAFHSTMPEHARTYAVPRQWREQYGVRRYGFHGTSHSYVSREAARILGRDVADCNVIVAHLGNGASISAVQGGRCIDTSMGMTPLEGLIMGTRCGDIDPALIFYLHRQTGASFEELDQTLNQKSGMAALAGESDMRAVEAAADHGDADSQMALEAYAYRIRKYIGAYTAALGRVDAVVFTAGIGENSPGVRARVLDGLSGLGIEIDQEANHTPGTTVISTAVSSTKVLVIATNEESEIAQQAVALVRHMPDAD